MGANEETHGLTIYKVRTLECSALYEMSLSDFVFQGSGKEADKVVRTRGDGGHQEDRVL